MMLLGGVRHFAVRLGWGLIDQAISSLTNFAVGIYVARSLGAKGFGAFSLAFVTWQVAVSASRGLASDPLTVRYSGATPEIWRRVVARSTGTAIVVGLVAGACCLVVSGLLSGSTAMAFLALGLTLPGLLFQDSWRYAFFSAGKGRQAAVNDLVWGFALAVGLLAIGITESSNVFWFVSVWGGSATFAGFVGAFQARLLPRFFEVQNWLSEHRDIAPRYLGENLSISCTQQLQSYGLGAIAGLAAVGSLRAAELLLGPFNVVIMGIGMMAVPEGARVLRRSVRQLWPFCLLLGSLQAGAAITWGLALLVLSRMGLGVRLLGPLWQPASELLLPATLAVVNAGFAAGARVGLRTLGAASRSFQSQAIGSTVYLTAGLGGAVVAGALGTAWGAAIATLIGAGIWWWQLDRALREFERHRRPLEGTEALDRSTWAAE
jgi:O-antigen/teichoic acid export membrane protein